MRASEFTIKNTDVTEGQAFVSDEVWRLAKHLAHRIEKRVENFGHKEIAMIANEVGLASSEVAEILELTHGMSERVVPEEYTPWNSKEKSPRAIELIKKRLEHEKKHAVPGQLKKPGSKRKSYQTNNSLDYFAKTGEPVDYEEGMEEQFCENCGGSLAEAGKASRALCKSSRSNAELGASQLSSCKAQGLRGRESSKRHEVGGKRQSIKGMRVKGHKYGGPLPYNKSDLTK